MVLERPHLLIVDDEPLNRDLLRRVLEEEYELSEAGDVDEALEVLEDGEGAPIRMVLCDYLMPGRTGADLAVIVRERWPGIPFVLITGYDGDDEVISVHEQGLILKIICKPWRARELRSVIRERITGES